MSSDPHFEPRGGALASGWEYRGAEVVIVGKILGAYYIWLPCAYLVLPGGQPDLVQHCRQLRPARRVVEAAQDAEVRPEPRPGFSPLGAGTQPLSMRRSTRCPWASGT